ncbi:WxL protein peptidoglycan domain-containing protein [Anaerobacillus sp. MEB173]|uniref:WxL protein peptidoglycan domain-containing protein n=1 Tax=Anaerobacillus sp. MEB173 TaxID=3383345 RepID=UPI003F8E8639
MKIREIHWILLSIMFLSFPSFLVYAEGNDFEFRVEPIFPESQIGNQGYYHLKGNPNETVTLQARVINDSDKELNVTIRSLNAYSGNQGILYQTEPILEGTAITNDEFQFTKFVKNPKELTLSPLGSEVVEFSVNVPDINGTLLGSIEFRVFQGTEELTKKEEDSQLLIDQYRAVNLGVQVDITDYKETPSLTFESPHYSPEQMAIMVPMGNSHPVIVSNISGTYKVTKSKDEPFSLTGDMPSFKMAPMTAFHYPIRWSEGTLEPDDYNVTFTLNVNGQTQTYEQTVSIRNEQVKETQEKMEERGEVEIAPKTFPWTTVIIALLLVIVVILLWMMKRSKPQRKDRKYPIQDPNDT